MRKIPSALAAAAFFALLPLIVWLGQGEDAAGTEREAPAVPSASSASSEEAAGPSPAPSGGTAAAEPTQSEARGKASEAAKAVEDEAVEAVEAAASAKALEEAAGEGGLVTRAAFAALLAGTATATDGGDTGEAPADGERAAGPAELEKLESFRDAGDIPEWAKDGVAAAAANGWMVGEPNGRFRPNDPITRAEAAVALVRRVDGPGGGEAAELTYTDAASIPAWAREAAARAAAWGFLEEGAEFRAGAPLTRAEFERAAELAAGGE